MLIITFIPSKIICRFVYLQDNVSPKIEFYFLREDIAYQLFCEQCKYTTHMDCLNPPLDEIPTDDWYCPDCKNDSSEIVQVPSITIWPLIKQRYKLNQVQLERSPNIYTDFPQTTKFISSWKSYHDTMQKSSFLSHLFRRLENWATNSLRVRIRWLLNRPVATSETGEEVWPQPEGLRCVPSSHLTTSDRSQVQTLVLFVLKLFFGL